MCCHQPTCPASEQHDREAARVVAGHPEQGWSLLCNGVLAFEDTGELLPNGVIIPPHRPTTLSAMGGEVHGKGIAGTHIPLPATPNFSSGTGRKHRPG